MKTVTYKDKVFNIVPDSDGSTSGCQECAGAMESGICLVYGALAVGDTPNCMANNHHYEEVHDKDLEHIMSILGRVTYKTWYMHVGVDGNRPYMQWQFNGPCSKTGEVQLHMCRKWFLSPHMTDGELVQTAFSAALQAEEHECREFFKYGGHVIMNPHLSLEALTSRAHMTEGRT